MRNRTLVELSFDEPRLLEDALDAVLSLLRFLDLMGARPQEVDDIGPSGPSRYSAAAIRANAAGSTVPPCRCQIRPSPLTLRDPNVAQRNRI